MPPNRSAAIYEIYNGANYLNFRHDQRLVQKLNKIPRDTRSACLSAAPAEIPDEPLPTKQFGVSLSFIKEHNNMDAIPPIVRQCVEFLSQPDGESFALVSSPLDMKVLYGMADRNNFYKT